MPSARRIPVALHVVPSDEDRVVRLLGLADAVDITEAFKRIFSAARVVDSGLRRESGYAVYEGDIEEVDHLREVIGDLDRQFPELLGGDIRAGVHP